MRDWHRASYPSRRARWVTEEIALEEITGDFMWMFGVVLTDGMSLQAYKHIDARCYIHLASNGDAFVYESPDRYRRKRGTSASFQVVESAAPGGDGGV